MSFILQFFDAPEATTVEAAVAYVDERGDTAPPLGEKFSRFVASVTELFPDLSDEDEDGGDERNLWPEGLEAAWGDEGVVNVGIKTSAAEEGVLSVIASKAARCGLQVLDPQNAMLYRTDHMVVDGQGRVSPFRMLTPFAARLMKPLAGGLTPSGVSRTVAAALLEAAGTSREFTVANPRSLRVVRRRQGDIHQAVAVAARESADGIEVLLDLWLSSEKLSSVWLALLPEESVLGKATRDARRNGTAQDFVYSLPDVVPLSDGEDQARFGRVYTLRSPADLDAYVAALRVYAAAKVLPWLDRMQDLPMLAGIALAPDNLEWARTGTVAPPEQLATLVLARLARPDSFETVAAAFENHPRKSQSWGEFGDAAATILGGLVAHLRALPR